MLCVQGCVTASQWFSLCLFVSEAAASCCGVPPVVGATSACMPTSGCEVHIAASTHDKGGFVYTHSSSQVDLFHHPRPMGRMACTAATSSTPSGMPSWGFQAMLPTYSLSPFVYAPPATMLCAVQCGFSTKSLSLTVGRVVPPARRHACLCISVVADCSPAPLRGQHVGYCRASCDLRLTPGCWWRAVPSPL